jgi:glycerate kinase
MSSGALRIIVAPTAFKGSLTPVQAAQAVARGLTRSGLAAECVLMPLADGGDGTLEVFLSAGGRQVTVDALDALGRPIRAPIGLLPDGQTAVIEMAQAAGLARLAHHEIDAQSALRASTAGVGWLIRAALDAGARRLLIGLGGSATTDGGAGCLRALGLGLLDRDGLPIGDGGGALTELAHIDTQALDPRLAQAEVVIATDVQNPAVGEQGAAAVFGPQKGADPAGVAHLEAGLRRWLTLAGEVTGRPDLLTAAGGGAAGALAAGLLAFMPARIQSGVDLLLDTLNFDQKARGAALVITGEGQMDGQTLGGKAPQGIAKRAAAYGIPTVALVGGLQADDELLHQAGFAAVLPVVTGPMQLEQALRDADALVEQAGVRLGHLLLLGGRLRAAHPQGTEGD